MGKARIDEVIGEEVARRRTETEDKTAWTRGTTKRTGMAR